MYISLINVIMHIQVNFLPRYTKKNREGGSGSRGKTKGVGGGMGVVELCELI